MSGQESSIASIGAPAKRLEDARLLSGQGRFVDDIKIDGILHAAFLRSPVAHGYIRSIETSAAEAAPGVHAVITATDVAAAMGGDVPNVLIRALRIPEIVPFEQPVIAHGMVRYVGEPVAMAIAESRALAEDAVDLIGPEIDSIPAVTNWRDSLDGGTAREDPSRGNLALTYTATKGATEVSGPYRRKETLRVHRHSGFPLETRGLVADWQDAAGRMTVHGAAKVPFFARRALAEMTGLPIEKIDMIEVDVGGSFGIRGEVYLEDFLVPFAAKLLTRPVKWIEDRRENLLGANHSREMEAELEIVCAEDGRVVFWAARSWSTPTPMGEARASCRRALSRCCSPAPTKSPIFMFSP